jgi:hypothetical protein
MVFSLYKLFLLVVVSRQLCLSTAFVFPSTSTATSASSPHVTFLPSSVTADDMLTSSRPQLAFLSAERTALNTKMPKLHVEDSELGDVADIILELKELLTPEPAVLSSMGKLLELAFHLQN